MNPNVAIITLNWNGWQDTIECLESLYDIDYENYDVILVDNASTDESLAKIDAYCTSERKLAPHFTAHVVRSKPIEVTQYYDASGSGAHLSEETTRVQASRALTLIRNQKNYGFAEGSNIAVAYALDALHPDYVLLLNNDTIVHKHFLSTLVDAAQRDEEIGLIQPKILRYVVAMENLGSPTYVLPWNARSEMRENDEGQHAINSKDRFFFANAACVLIRKSLLIALSGECFDPQLFAYYEDVDLSWMARLIGFKVVYCPKSVCYHKLSAAFGKRSPFTAYLHDRNTVRVMIKNYSLRTLIFVLPLTIVLMLLRSLFTSVINLDLSELYGFFKALLWNTSHLTGTLIRRRQIQSKRKMSDREIWSHLIPYSLNVQARLKEAWGRRHS